MNTKTMTTLLRVVLLAAAVLCGIFFLWFLPSYGQGVQQADPEFTWAYWHHENAIHAFSHPDYTVGTGIAPVHAACAACGLYRRWGITPRLEDSYSVVSGE